MAVYGIRAAEPANGVNATELQSEMQRVATVKASADVESSRSAVDPSAALETPKVHIMLDNRVPEILSPDDDARAGTILGTDFIGSALPAVPGSAVAKAPRKAPAKAPAIKLGHIITKDTDYKGTGLYSFRLSFAQATADSVTVTNIYGLESDVRMYVNTTTGEVSIPQQVLYKHKDYGDVSIIPLSIKDGKLYLVEGDLKGAIDDKGVVTVGCYGIAVTSQGNYYGRVFNAFQNGVWSPANATVRVNAVAGSKTGQLEYGMLLEKTGENEMTFYGLGTIDNNTQILTGRMTPGKKIQLSAQTIYSNMSYGKFCNYPAELTQDASTGKWKVKADSKSPMVFTADADGVLSIPGWVISAYAGPSTYVGYAYDHMSITPMESIVWPAPASMDMVGKGTEAEPFMVTKPAHFDYIAERVADGDDLDGVHFKMGNDIDMSALDPSRYVTIGDINNRFAGIFDGGSHTISGLLINGKGYYTSGMFGVLDSTAVVKNLNFDSSIIMGNGDCVGLLAGMSFGTVENVHVSKSLVDGNGTSVGGLTASASGKFRNCSFSGTVNSTGNTGAITGELVNGSITDCHAQANVIADGVVSTSYTKLGGIVGIALRATIDKCWMSGTISDKVGYHDIGGIAAYSSDNEITNCFNMAAIQAKRAAFGSSGSSDDGDTHTGGIAGSVMETKVHNCYNAGTIIKPDQSDMVGGIVGFLSVKYVSTSNQPMRMEGQSHIDNCFNTGQVISSAANSHKGIWGYQFISNSYKGDSPDKQCLFNVMFDQQLNGFRDERFGKDTRELTGKLPAGFDASIWSVEAGKYPVLKTFAGIQAQELASSPVMLREADNANKVKVEFDLTASTNVNWELGHDTEQGETATETKALRREGNKVVVKDKYANATVQALTADNWAIKLYRLAVVPKVFDGEGTAEDPYQIKTAADFKKLDEAVGTYGQSHLGDFFAVVNDIDFAADTTFMGVGAGKIYEFEGSLDGRNHSIAGMNIHANVLDDNGKTTNNGTVRTGLFGTIGANGSVKNVTIAANNVLRPYQQGGTITGLNAGKISNCKNYAEVRGAGSYVGGIAGANYVGGIIEDCYNAGNIYNSTNYIGGITGLNMQEATVLRCQNDGIVRDSLLFPKDTRINVNEVGGITGYNNGTILSSVNNGDISAFYAVGGIVGVNSKNYDEGVIKGCLNNGFVTCYQNSTERGGIAGKLNGAMTAENNYYDASINVNGAAMNVGHDGVKGVSSSELVAGTPLAGLDAEVFDFAAGKYPVLKKFAAEKATTALRSMYVAFAPNQRRNNVVKNVPLSTASGISFSLQRNETFKIAGSTLNVTVPTGTVIAADTLTAVLGDFTKVYALNSLPPILKGEGTAEAPYLIETPADWNKLANFMMESKWEYEGNHFRIAADLDFKGDSISVIGAGGVNFQGIMDGANHEVGNFVYLNENSSTRTLKGPNLYLGKKIGVFGVIGQSGAVRNMTVNGKFQCYSNAAGVAGEVYGTLENITFKGTAESTKSTIASGIANSLYEKAVIRNCVNEGTVISKTNYVQGIVYETKKGSLVENCVNRGTLKGTLYYSGIAYSVEGGIKGCSNESNDLVCITTGKAPSTFSGIVNTLKANGWLEDCYNKADIDLVEGFTTAGSNIYPIFGNTTTRKATDEDLSGGYVRNCHNTGNLKASTGVFGIGSTVKVNWTVENCSNTGNIATTKTSATAAGLFATIGEYSNGSATHLTKVLNCFNTGNIVNIGAKTAGIANTINKFVYIADCYNTGDITVTDNASLCAAGLVAQISGAQMERCFNAGNIKVSNNGVGGLVGYIASGDASFPAKLSSCFNIGDVESTYTGTATQGNAGGLGGYLSTASADNPIIVENCYNTGNITAQQRVAGLFAGAFSPFPIVENCYNSGKITCLKADANGRYYWSGTTFTNNYTYGSDEVFMLAGHKNCFYDKTVNPGAQFRNVPNSGKTTAEMQALAISDAYTSLGHGGYPVLASHAQKDEAVAGSPLILLADVADESHENVTKAFALVAPEGAVWTVDDPSKLTLEEKRAFPNGQGNLKLTCTYKGIPKNFLITVNGIDNGVDGIDAGKEVKSISYIGLDGQITADPVSGQVYIVRTVFTDGTMTVAKKLVVR